MTPLAAAIASIPAFSSRTFIPMFVGALLLRFAPDAWLVPDIGLLAGVGLAGGAPTWFTHDITLTILGILCCVEIGAEKQPELRSILNEIDQFAKPVAAMIVAAGYFSVADQEFIEQQIDPGVPAQSGFIGWIMVLGFAGSVFAVAQIRSSLMATLDEFDADDDLGLQKYLSWLEDFFAAGGILAAFLFPLLMMALAVIGVFGLWGLQRFFEKREAAKRVPCPACGAPMHAAASACPACKADAPEPKRVNWIGVASNKPAKDNHALRLESFRRCPRCAERLPRRAVPQDCPACGVAVLATEADRVAYDRAIRRRLPVALLVSTGLSMIPVIGLIPAVLYSRLSVVAPYRRYVSRARTIWIRLGLRLLLVFAVAIQFIPIVGGLMLPMSALLSHSVYRKAFLSGAGEVPDTSGAPGVPEVPDGVDHPEV